jgi:hypothetical protein
MAEYVATVHQAYLSTATTYPPAVQGRMSLMKEPFTVVAAGAGNLHVIATRQALAAPRGKEVAIEDSIGPISWSLRFYDPVVIPALGLIDESSGPAAESVRRTLGITNHLYHLIVGPGSQLSPHHAGHAGSGLANSQVAEARDFESIRARVTGREALVDEMEGAALAGLVRAHALLAAEIAPRDEGVRRLAGNDHPEPADVRKTLLAALRGGGSG